MSSDFIIQAHNELEMLYINADQLKGQLSDLLSEAKITMSHIFDNNIALSSGEKSRTPPSFDSRQVKVDARLTDSIDRATRVLLHVTTLA